MGQTAKRPECVLGFYETVQQATGETSGGLLVTSHLGRPIEFQCSLPVRPNATQQTLYGGTLRPFLVGELIAGALRDKLTARPDILFVADPQAFNPEIWKDTLVCSFRQPSGTGSVHKFRNYEFWIAETGTVDSQSVLTKLEQFLPEGADLREPLTRVELALKEAMGQAA